MRSIPSPLAASSSSSSHSSDFVDDDEQDDDDEEEEEEEKDELPKWEICSSQRMSGKRHGAAAVSVGDKFILLGGYHYRYLNTVEMFCDSQSRMLPNLPVPRHACAAVANANRVFVMGGYNGTCLNTMDMLDLETMKWTFLPPMPTARYGCEAVLVNNTIMVLGGTNGANRFDVAESYNLETQQWTRLPSMSCTRCYFGAVLWLDDSVCVFGGEGAASSAEQYHPATQKWTRITMPYPRKHCRAIHHDKQVYLLGGHNGSHMTETPLAWNGKAWSVLDAPLHTKRMWCAAALVSNRVVVVAGGTNHHGKDLDTMERLVLPDTTVPCLTSTPNIPPVPIVLSKRKRKIVLHEWLEQAGRVRKDYLEVVEGKRRKIHQVFRPRLKAIQEELGVVLEKKRRLEQEMQDKVQELQDCKTEWLQCMEGEMDDARDMLDHLMAPPPVVVGHKALHHEYPHASAQWEMLLSPMTRILYPFTLLWDLVTKEKNSC